MQFDNMQLAWIKISFKCSIGAIKVNYKKYYWEGKGRLELDRKSWVNGHQDFTLWHQVISAFADIYFQCHCHRTYVPHNCRPNITGLVIRLNNLVFCVYDLVFCKYNLVFCIYDLVFRIYNLVFRIYNLVFRIYNIPFHIYNILFRIYNHFVYTI